MSPQEKIDRLTIEQLENDNRRLRLENDIMFEKRLQKIMANLDESKQNVEESKQNILYAQQSIDESRQNVEESKQNILYAQQSIDESKQTIKQSEKYVFWYPLFVGAAILAAGATVGSLITTLFVQLLNVQ